MSFRQSKSIKFGSVGLLLGAFAGFIIRDEYYFPSYKRIDELIQEYYEKDKEIDTEIEELNEKLKNLSKKGKTVLQDSAKSTKKANEKEHGK